MGRNSERSTPATIDGVTKAVAKKIIKYVFGSWFYSIRQEGFEFHVILLNEVKDESGTWCEIDSDLVDDFLSYWNNNVYKIRIVKISDIS